MTEICFLRTTVILPVADIDDTLAWYEHALGFQTTFVHGAGRRGEAEHFANYAVMVRDAIEVNFILDEGGPIWTRAGTGYLSVNVRGIEALYDQVKANGVPIDRELQRENWPARGFGLRDPSGNSVHIEESL